MESKDDLQDSKERRVTGFCGRSTEVPQDDPLFRRLVELFRRLKPHRRRRLIEDLKETEPNHDHDR